MMNRKNIKYILVVLISVVIIPGLFSSPLAFGDTSPSIEVPDITLEAFTVANYDIKSNTLTGELKSKNEGTITLDYEDSAELQVSIDSNQDLPSWFKPSRLKIKLGEKGWEPLGGDPLTLDGEKEVSYDLKYNFGNQSTGENQQPVPSPGSYSIGLDFSLTQTVGCYDPIIDITSQELGPGEHLQLELTSSCGPVGNAKVDAGSAGVKYTGQENGKVNWGGGQVPEEEIEIEIEAEELEDLDGDLGFDYSGDFGDELKVYVSGSLGPGKQVELRVVDEDGDPVEGADVSGSFSGTTGSNGEFSFTFPSGNEVGVEIDIESDDRKAELVFEYEFEKAEEEEG